MEIITRTPPEAAPGAMPPLARPRSPIARVLCVTLLLMTIVSWLLPDPVPMIDEILLPILTYLCFRRGRIAAS